MKLKKLKLKTYSVKEKNNTFLDYLFFLEKRIIIMIITGIIASLLYFFQYGGGALVRVYLSWIIGITLMSTLIGLIMERYQKQKKNKSR